MIDTLKYAQALELVGVDRQQAETHARLISDVLEADMATKQDLKELEYRLVIRLSAIMATMLTVTIGIVGVLLKFVH